MLRKKITLVCLLAMLLNVCVLPAAAQMETETAVPEITAQETVPTTEATVVRETEPPAVDYVDPTEFPQAETVPETTAPLETEPVAETVPEVTQPAETEPEETPNPADRLAAGEFHNVWISADGTVNAVGKVGAYSGAEKWHNVTKVAAWNLTIGVRKNGKVVLAGDNTNKYNYGVISGWSDIVDVAAGEKNIAAVTAAGTVVAAGSNQYHQCDISHWTEVKQVAVGECNLYGLKKDGTVVCSGNPYTKQAKVSTWRDITAISAGNHFVAGLRTDGTVTAKGDSFSGRADVDEWENITAIAAGSNHLVGLRADGTVIAAGENGMGQCNVGGWTDIVAVSAGRFHTVGMRSDGTIVVTGSDGYGQCDVE